MQKPQLAFLLAALLVGVFAGPYAFATDSLMDHYTVSDGASATSYRTAYTADYWTAQTFTPSENYSLTSVKLLVGWHNLSTDTATARIFATADTQPTGEALGTAMADETPWTDYTDPAYQELIFSSPVELTAGTLYAIVLAGYDNTIDNRIHWILDDSPGIYTGGHGWETNNAGSSWTAHTGEDFLFETYGIGGGGESTTTPPVVTATSTTADLLLAANAITLHNVIAYGLVLGMLGIIIFILIGTVV